MTVDAGFLDEGVAELLRLINLPAGLPSLEALRSRSPIVAELKGAARACRHGRRPLHRRPGRRSGPAALPPGHGRPAAAGGVPARRGLGDRGPRDPGRSVPGSGQPGRLRAAVGRLPAGTRTPLPGRARRHLGRAGLGGRQRGAPRSRRRTARHRRRQRGRQPGRGSRAQGQGRRPPGPASLRGAVRRDRLPHRRPLDDGTGRGVLRHARQDGVVLGHVRPPHR